MLNSTSRRNQTVASCLRSFAPFSVSSKFYIRLNSFSIAFPPDQMTDCRSTLVSLLQRHYDPTEGSIMLDDTDLLDVDAGWYRDQLGVVSQDPRLFSETISENIAYGKEGLSQVRNYHKTLASL